MRIGSGIEVLWGNDGRYMFTLASVVKQDCIIIAATPQKILRVCACLSCLRSYAHVVSVFNNALCTKLLPAAQSPPFQLASTFSLEGGTSVMYGFCKLSRVRELVPLTRQEVHIIAKFLSTGINFCQHSYLGVWPSWCSLFKRSLKESLLSSPC